MFRIKICGITNVEDAVMAVDSGADAIGLNFYEKSSRFVSRAIAKQIVDAVGKRSECWGVFVNLPNAEIERVTSEAGLYGIQLHGDESSEQVAAMASSLWPPASPLMQEFLQVISEDERRGLESGL